jgi:CRP-like cAMP-binding protein
MPKPKRFARQTEVHLRSQLVPSGCPLSSDRANFYMLAPRLGKGMSYKLSLREAVAERGLSRQSAAKWVRRYRLLGAGGLVDFSSRAHRCPRSTPVQLAERVERLRRERKTGVQIAQLTGLSRATVSRILTRLNQMPPITRSARNLDVNNLLRHDT